MVPRLDNLADPDPFGMVDVYVLCVILCDWFGNVCFSGRYRNANSILKIKERVEQTKA
jgi:hypothetical protein